MGLLKQTLLLLLVFLCLTSMSAAPSTKQVFSFDEFDESKHTASFEFIGDQASIDQGALQLTPDTRNDAYTLYNKSGRIMYHQPFELWQSDDLVASFNTFFLLNNFRESNWIPGQGLAFIIAPNLTIPGESYGQWLGLTNSTTDGNPGNQIVAIEFDTVKQDFDPDDNHVGLNINSVHSSKTVSLNDSSIGIEISPNAATNYSVWVEYDGNSKVLKVYMVKDKSPKPRMPLLRETINLKHYVKQESYLGFAASTGHPDIQLNCILKWSLEMENLPNKKDWTWLKIAAPAAALLVICGVGLGVAYVKRRKRTCVEKFDMMGNLKRLPGMPREFKYKDLKKATNNFDESLRLGQGGFGVVYKGILHDNDHLTEIAVKKFSRDNIKGKHDFLAELTIIHRLRHKHLVPLVGWCYEGGKLLLVYDFMPNGSLEKYLYEPSKQNLLNWERRYKIVTGVASALHYLHNEFDQKVVHRDLKGSNIMLDSNFNARLGDFGLARALDDGRTSYADLGTSGVPGTMGYVAPECFHTRKATPESDVYGFGAVILEIICGKNPGTQIHHQQHHYSLVEWVWMLHREGRILEAVDKTLGNEYEVDEAKRLLLLGLACSHPIASERPQTRDIQQIITGTVSIPRVSPFRPVFIWPSTDITSTTESTLSNIKVSS